MSTLNERQNHPASVDKLAAQNQIYADAKTKLGVYLTLSIPVILILNLIVKPMFLEDWFSLGVTYDLTDTIALYALLLAAYELIFLKGSIESHKLKAATIQEDFDCIVYELEWNQALCGNRVCDSEVQKYSQKYQRKGKKRSRLENWYTPEIEQLEDENNQALACQKENLGWDISQRQSFVKLIKIVVAISVLASMIAGFYYEISLKSLILSVLIPCWPALSYAIQNLFENRKALSDKEKLKNAIESAASASLTVKDLRNIQNIIFLNRSSNSLIFDWFYTFHRESNQNGVSYASIQFAKRMMKG